MNRAVFSLLTICYTVICALPEDLLAVEQLSLCQRKNGVKGFNPQTRAQAVVLRKGRCPRGFRMIGNIVSEQSVHEITNSIIDAKLLAQEQKAGPVGPQGIAGPQGPVGPQGRINMGACYREEYVGPNYRIGSPAQPGGSFAVVDAVCRDEHFLLNYSFSPEYAPLGETPYVPNARGYPISQMVPASQLSIVYDAQVEVVRNSIRSRDRNSAWPLGFPVPLKIIDGYGSNGIPSGFNVSVQLTSERRAQYEVDYIDPSTGESRRAEFRLRGSLFCCPID